jgi:hypothetical protein
MPGPKAETHQAESVTKALKAKGLAHLRARLRGAFITIESGPPDDPWPRARLRRDTVHLWRLEMATHSGRWENTPFRGQMTELIDILVDNFGWTLTPIDENPARTSDRRN